MDGVAVAAVVLGRVDAALRGDGVSASRRVVERERIDLVAELGKRCCRRRAGKPVPTTMTLNLRLLLGLTNFTSFL